MRRSFVIILRGASWAAILAFVAASVWFGFSTHQLFVDLQRPGSLPLTCGNVVADPLCFLLSYGAPVAGLGVMGVIFDVRRNHRRASPAWIGAFPSLSVAVALLVFGTRFFEGSLADVSSLFSQVWWIGPLGRMLGV